jgi:HD-GYP domain-containing protein (c-di-GMP phosphodiesterase class II)
MTEPIVPLDETVMSLYCHLPTVAKRDEPFWEKLTCETDYLAIKDYGQARLGMATSLLMALAAKHQPAAMHSVRVALGLSGWANHLGMDSKTAQVVEIAGAMHDLGKIGVCDAILQKRGKLTPEEYAVIDYHRHNAISILTPSLVSREIAETIYFGMAWFDGSRAEFSRKGQQLPIAARMLAIADAFDSMTAESCYREFRNKEEAIAELFAQGDIQFDLEMVRSFAAFIETHNVWTSGESAAAWLVNLKELGHDNTCNSGFGVKTAGQLPVSQPLRSTIVAGPGLSWSLVMNMSCRSIQDNVRSLDA